jgi:hypothetical protein
MNTTLSSVTQVKRFFRSLRAKATVKMKCTCLDQDNKEKYGIFQVQINVSASKGHEPLKNKLADIKLQQYESLQQ